MSLYDWYSQNDLKIAGVSALTLMAMPIVGPVSAAAAGFTAITSLYAQMHCLLKPQFAHRLNANQQLDVRTSLTTAATGILMQGVMLANLGHKLYTAEPDVLMSVTVNTVLGAFAGTFLNMGFSTVAVYEHMPNEQRAHVF